MKFKFLHIFILISLKHTCSLKLPEFSPKVTRSLLRAKNHYEDITISKPEPLGNLLDGNTKYQGFHSYSNAGFPEVEYPTTIYDTFTPFYYKNKGCEVLGSFAFDEKPKTEVNNGSKACKLENFLSNLKIQCKNKTENITQPNNCTDIVIRIDKVNMVEDCSKANVTNSIEDIESSQQNLEDDLTSHLEEENSDATIIEIIVTNNSTQEDQSGILQRLNVLEVNDTCTLIENKEIFNITEKPEKQHLRHLNEEDAMNIADLIRRIIKEELDQRKEEITNITETIDFSDSNRQNSANTSRNEEIGPEKFTITINEISVPMQIETDNCTYLVTEGHKMENNNTEDTLKTNQILSLINENITTEHDTIQNDIDRQSTNKSSQNYISQSENDHNDDLNYPEIIKIVIKTDQVNVEPNITTEEIIVIDEEPLTNVSIINIQEKNISEIIVENAPFIHEPLNKNMPQIYDDTEVNNQNVSEIVKGETNGPHKIEQVIYESPEYMKGFAEQVSDVNNKRSVVPSEIIEKDIKYETIIHEKPNEKFIHKEKQDVSRSEDTLVNEILNDTNKQINVINNYTNYVADQQSILKPNQVNNNTELEITLNKRVSPYSTENAVEVIPLIYNVSVIDIPLNEVSEELLNADIKIISIQENDINNIHKKDDKQDVETENNNFEVKEKVFKSDHVSIINEALISPIKGNVTMDKLIKFSVIPVEKTIQARKDNESHVIKDVKVNILNLTVIDGQEKRNSSYVETTHMIVPENYKNITFIEDSLSSVIQTNSTVDAIIEDSPKVLKDYFNKTEAIKDETVKKIAPIVFKLVDPMANNITLERENITKTNQQNFEDSDSLNNAKQIMGHDNEKTIQKNTNNFISSPLTNYNADIDPYLNKFKILFNMLNNPIVQVLTSLKNNHTSTPTTKEQETREQEGEELIKKLLKNKLEEKTSNNATDINSFNRTEVEVTNDINAANAENTIIYNLTDAEEINMENFLNNLQNETYDIKEEQKKTEQSEHHKNDIKIVQLEVLDENDNIFNNNESLNDNNFMNNNNQNIHLVNNNTLEQEYENNFASNPLNEKKSPNKTNNTEIDMDNRNKNVELVCNITISDVIKSDAEFFETLSESEESDYDDDDLYSCKEDDSEPETSTENINDNFLLTKPTVILLDDHEFE